MKSPDWGRSWCPVTPPLHEDVHEVTTCPASQARVYANTAKGVYVSDDCGRSWNHRARDLHERYGRAITVSPADPDLLLATVSDGPRGEDVHGQLFQSEDARLNWVHVKEGFPASSPGNVDTFHVRFSEQGVAWAAVETTLYVGRARATQWQPF